MRYKSITYLPSRISTALIFTPRYNSALSSTVTSPGWDVIPLQGYPLLMLSFLLQKRNSGYVLLLFTFKSIIFF